MMDQLNSKEKFKGSFTIINNKSLICFWLIFASASFIITKDNLLHQTEYYRWMYILLSLSLIPTVMYIDRRSISALLIILLFISLTLPTLLKGVIAGIDSWWYIGSAESIASNGYWDPMNNSPGAHQFPGIQLLAVVVSEVVGFDLVASAKFITPLIKILPIFVPLVLSKHLSIDGRYGALMALAMVTYGSYHFRFAFHHMLIGIILKIFLLYLLIMWYTKSKSSRWPLLIFIVYWTITVSHQLSMVHSAIILASFFILVSLFSGAHSDEGNTDEIIRPFLERGRVFNFVALLLIGSAMYYLWVSRQFIVQALYLQLNTIESNQIFSLFGSTGSIETIPQLEVVDRKSYFKSGWPTKFGSEQITMAILFLFTGVSGLILLLRRLHDNALFQMKESEIFILHIWVGIFTMLRFLTALSIGFFVGTTRVFIATLPFALSGIISTSPKQIIKPMFTLGLVLFIVLNGTLYPAYYFEAQPSLDSDNPTMYLSEEEQQALDWASGETLVGGILASSYIEGIYSKGEVIQSAEVYAKNSSAIPPSSNIYVSREYMKLLFIRKSSVDYRIPTSLYRSYEYHTEWGQIYDSGNTSIFHPNSSSS